MAVPQWFPTPFEWVYPIVVGQDWPSGDEDQLRTCAQAWSDAIGRLVTLTGHGNATTQGVGYSVQSASYESFLDHWKRYVDGDESYLGQIARQCETLAANLLDQSTNTEYTKLAINIQLVILGIQLAWAAAMAVFTAVAAAAIPVWITAARAAVNSIVGQFLQGVLLAILPDLITQGVQLADGHRANLDVRQLASSAASGAIGGLVGVGAGALTRGLLRSGEGTLGNRLAHLSETWWGGAAHSAATNAATAALSIPANQLIQTGHLSVWTPQEWQSLLTAGGSGAATHVAFHAAQRLPVAALAGQTGGFAVRSTTVNAPDGQATTQYSDGSLRHSRGGDTLYFHPAQHDGTAPFAGRTQVGEQYVYFDQHGELGRTDLAGVPTTTGTHLSTPDGVTLSRDGQPVLTVHDDGRVTPATPLSTPDNGGLGQLAPSAPRGGTPRLRAMEPPNAPPPAAAGDRATAAVARALTEFGQDPLVAPALHQAKAVLAGYQERVAIAGDRLPGSEPLAADQRGGDAAIARVRQAAGDLLRGRNPVQDDLRRLTDAVGSLRQASTALGTHYGELTGRADLRTVERAFDVAGRALGDLDRGAPRPSGVEAVDRRVERSRRVLTELRERLNPLRSEPDGDLLSARLHAEEVDRSARDIQRRLDQALSTVDPRMRDLLAWDGALDRLDGALAELRGGRTDPATESQVVDHGGMSWQVRWEPQVRHGVTRWENVRVEPMVSEPGADPVPLVLGDERRFDYVDTFRSDDLRAVLGAALRARGEAGRYVQLDVVDPALSNDPARVTFTDSHRVLGEEPAAAGHEDLLRQHRAEHQALADGLRERVERLRADYGPDIGGLSERAAAEHHGGVQDLAARQRAEWSRAGQPTAEMAAAHHDLADQYWVLSDDRPPAQRARDEVRHILDQAHAAERERLAHDHARNLDQVRDQVARRRAELDLAERKAARRELSPAARQRLADRLAGERSTLDSREPALEERFRNRLREIADEHAARMKLLANATEGADRWVPRREDPAVLETFTVSTDEQVPTWTGGPPGPGTAAGYIQHPVRFEVRRTADTTYLILHASLTGPPEARALVEARARLGLELYANRFLREMPARDGTVLLAAAEFDQPGVGLADTVHLEVTAPPLDGRTNADQGTVHAFDTAETVAHELLHSLGLTDEYHANWYSAGRETPWSAAVRERDSIMGPQRALGLEHGLTPEHVRLLSGLLDRARGGRHELPIPAAEEFRPVFEPLWEAQRHWRGEPELRLAGDLRERLARWAPDSPSLTSIEQPARRLAEAVDSLEQSLRENLTMLDPASPEGHDLLRDIRQSGTAAARHLRELESTLEDYIGLRADGDLDQAHRAAADLTALISSLDTEAETLRGLTTELDLLGGWSDDGLGLGGWPPADDEPDPSGGGPSWPRLADAPADAPVTGHQIAAGVSYVDNGPSFVDDVVPQDGVLVLVGHIGADGLLVGPGGRSLSAAEVAAALGTLPADAMIRIVGCGADASGFAQALADQTGRPVAAADTPVWVDEAGNVIAASVRFDDDGRALPTFPPDGHWTIRMPDGATPPEHLPGAEPPLSGPLDERADWYQLTKPKTYQPFSSDPRFAGIVAANRDNVNEYHAETYQREAKVWYPDDTRIGPNGTSLFGLTPALRHPTTAEVVRFDAVDHDGTLIDRKLRGDGSPRSFSREQLRAHEAVLAAVSVVSGVNMRVRWEVSHPTTVAAVQREITARGYRHVEVAYVPATAPDTGHSRLVEGMSPPQLATVAGRMDQVEWVAGESHFAGRRSYLYELHARRQYGCDLGTIRPALEYQHGNSPVVVFDAVTPGGVLVDRKTGTAMGGNEIAEAKVQSAALSLWGRGGCWEAISAASAAECRRVLNAAGVTNIAVVVVPVTDADLHQVAVAAGLEQP
jgi:hypothetical protein